MSSYIYVTGDAEAVVAQKRRAEEQISKLKEDPNTNKPEPKRRKLSHGSLNIICKK